MSSVYSWTIEAGPLTYTVFEDTTLLDSLTDGNSDNERSNGVCDPDQERIVLREGLAPGARLRTIFHEVLHTAIDRSKIQGHKDEEEIVEALDSTLLDTLQRNPELRRVLFGPGDFEPYIDPQEKE